ncbi:FIGNL1-interacting regulator of recombination and mitosis [Pelodytes ibericus]
MSQADIRDEMSHWSPEECRREVAGALPRLISQYQLSNNWADDIRVFNLLMEIFLPHVSLLELEDRIFSQVLPKAQKLFDDLIYEIASQASALSSQNVELKTSLRNILQNMIELLRALTTCVHQVCSLDEPITLENIGSLLACVLHILRAAFTHCKDSDAVYNGQLRLVSDVLQAVFKEAVSLQKHSMILLDKTTVNSTISEKESADMVSVLHSVLDICTVVSKMDHALHANTWKFIIKQSLKHQTLIGHQLRHHDIVNGLCDDLLLSFQSCLQLAEHMTASEMQEMTDQRLFQKTLKLCRFFANSLVHYTKEFMPFLSPSCNRLHQLYLQIHSQFPPSLYAVSISETHKRDIGSVFLVALDLLVSQLVFYGPFEEFVLNEKLELPPEHAFPQCLLLINILDKLPSLSEDVTKMWCSGSRFGKERHRMSIFRALFQIFTLCSPELSTPLVIQDVLVKRQNITFYQYACVHLCAFIPSLPPPLFSELECALLDAVLSHSMMTSLFAMDSWCFLARYGTANLCAHHVQVIACLVKSCANDCYQLTPLAVLLRRLFFLMAADHQAEFVEMFPPQEVEHFTVWQHISLTALPSALRTQVKKDLFTAGISHCRNWLKGKCVFNNLHQVKSSLSALLTACNVSGEHMDKEQQSAVTEIISQFWPLLNMNQILSQAYLQQTFCLLLALSALTIETMQTNVLIKIMCLLSCLSQKNPPSHVQLAMIDFLSVLGKIFIPPEAQATVLPKISSLFSSLLTDKSWMIKQHTLEAFTRFAEETSHEGIVPLSLKYEETKNEVIAFLNKAISTKEPEETRLERAKQEKGVLDAFFSIPMSQVEQELSLQPTARARHSESSSKLFDAHVQTAVNSLTSIQILLQESPAPDWFPEKLRNIQALLTTVEQGCQSHRASVNT